MEPQPETGLVVLAAPSPPAVVYQLPKQLTDDAQYFRNVRLLGAANTQRGYTSDLRSYEKYCDEQQFLPYPADETTLTGYLSYLAKKPHKVATIKRHLAAIQKRHQLSGLTSAAGTPALKEVMQGIGLALGKEQRQAPAFTIEYFKSCIEQLDLTTPSGLRDRAILLIGFAGAFRRSELVGLNIEHLKFRGKALVIRMGRSKTNQVGDLQEKALAQAENPLFCPITAFHDWVAQLNGRKKGPLFVSIRKGTKSSGQVPSEKRLTDKSVNNLVAQHLGEAAPGQPYTAHSFRSSFITTARLAGQSNEYIKNQTNHKSDAILQRYTRRSDVVTHNAVNALGL